MDKYGRVLVLLLLVAIVALHVQEISSASFDAPAAGKRGKTQRRIAELADHPSKSGAHIVSPCPDVLLSIKNNNKTSRWYGVISITADEVINGIDLHIQLDKSAELLGTWLGEVSTDDKIHYTITDEKMKILPGEIFAVRFFVKYEDTEAQPPNVKTISLNGRQICPLNKDRNASTSSPEAPDLTDQTEYVPFTLITSETTQSIAVDRSSSFPPQPTTPRRPTNLPPRNSRGSFHQHQANRVQLDNSQVASLLLSLLQRLARDRKALEDESLTYEVVHEDSFGSTGSNSGVSETQNLEGLLNSVLGVLMKDERREIPDARHDAEHGDADEVTPDFTSSPDDDPPSFPEAQEQTTALPTTISAEANRISSGGEAAAKERAFTPELPDAYYVDEHEDVVGGATSVFTPDPTESSSSPEIQEQTTSVPTTPPVAIDRAPGEGGSVSGERAFVTHAAPDTRHADEIESEEEASTHFPSDPTDSTPSPETLESTTPSLPTTANDDANRISSEGGATEGEEGDREIDPPWTTSPCPGIFSYFKHLAGSDVWYGNITIVSDEDVLGLRLDIELDKRAQGLGALLGNVTTKNHILYTIWNATATIEPGEPIYVYFFVKFDREDIVPPTVKTIRFNGVKICSANKAEVSSPPATVPSTLSPFEADSLSTEGLPFETTTKRQYEFSDIPPDVSTDASIRNNSVGEDLDLIQRQQPAYTPEIETTEQAVVTAALVTPSTYAASYSGDGYRPQYYADNLETTGNIVPTDAPTTKAERRNNYEETSEFIQGQQLPVYTLATTAADTGIPADDDAECGRAEFEQSPLTTFAKGSVMERWPWHAAIYQIRGDNLYYICGGTLVGKRTILTAARCLNDGQSNSTFDPKSLAVYVGKYSLLRWDEAVQYREIKEIHVHPEFDGNDVQGDVAVLILSSPVELSAYVQPACLGNGKQTDLSGDSQEGVVVGWGFDRYGNVSDVLTISRMPILTLRTCSSRYPKLFNYALSDKIYCAGYRSRTTICSGESGDGMFFADTDRYRTDRRGISPKWTIRGVASFTLSRKNDIGCSSRNFVVFTDVTKYYDWIEKYR